MSYLYEIAEFLACTLTFLYFYISAEHLFPRANCYCYHILFVCGIFDVVIAWKGASYLSDEVVSLLALLVCGLALLSLYGGNLCLRFLFLILFNAIDILVTSIIMSVLMIAFHVSQWELIDNRSPLHIIFLVIIYLIEGITVFILTHIKRKAFPLGRKEVGICVLLFLSDFIVTFFILKLLVQFHNASNNLTTICLIIDIVVIISSVATMILLKELQIEREKGMEYNLLKIQVRQQEQYIQRNREHYMELRKLRHNQRGYYRSYYSLLQAGKIKEVQDHIQDILDEPFMNTETIFTENLMLEALLQEMRQKCVEHNIEFITKVDYPKTYDDIDNMIIISNLLENAIQAQFLLSEQERKITLEIVQSEDDMSIMIQNSIPSSVLSVNPQLVTTQKNRQEHGFGIRSVKNLVMKKRGLIKFDETGNIFYVQVYIPGKQLDIN